MKIMTHVVCGFPDMKTCERLVKLFEVNGAAMVELQIPFSDPLADGPTIMEVNQKALDKGIDTDDCFSLMRHLKKRVKIPLLFMCYYNTIFAYGKESFLKKAAKCGAYGLIVPDLPPEEDKDYFDLCKKYGLHHIFVVAPNTSSRRMRFLAKKASGFVYCMARFGVTGKKTAIHKELKSYLLRVRKIFSLPVAVGFGIQSREQLKELEGISDIAVVGSKILKLMTESVDNTKALKKIEKFFRNFLS